MSPTTPHHCVASRRSTRSSCRAPRPRQQRPANTVLQPSPSVFARSELDQARADSLRYIEERNALWKEVAVRKKQSATRLVSASRSLATVPSEFLSWACCRPAAVRAPPAEQRHPRTHRSRLDRVFRDRAAARALAQKSRMTHCAFHCCQRSPRRFGGRPVK